MFEHTLSSKILFIFGAGIIFQIFIILALSSLFFAVGYRIPNGLFFLTFFLTIGFYLLASKFYFEEGGHMLVFVSISVIFILTLLASLSLARNFFDISYDGQTYHQETIVRLANGWNPFYHQLNDDEASRLSKWVNHYPKAAEIYETSVFKATGNIEDAKMFQFLLIAAAFSFLASLLLNLSGLLKWEAILIAGLAALNPVSIYQTLSFYIDGQMSSLLLCFIAVGAIAYFSSKAFSYFVLFMLIGIIVNIKSSAILYLGIISAAFLLFVFTSERIAHFRVAIFSVIAGFGVGILFLGFNPYITNTIHKGHPLYPVAGKEAIDYRPHNMPENFLKNNSVFTLFMSAFARSDLERGAGSHAEFKIPFTFNSKEIQSFSWTGPIEGGWGPLFGGMLIVSFIIFMMYLRSPNGYIKPLKAMLLSAVIIVSSSANPISSLARYTPHFFFLAIFFLFLAVLNRNIFSQFLAYLLMFLAIANISMIGLQYYRYNAQVTHAWDEKLDSLSRENRQTPISIDFDLFRSSGKLKFEAYKIPYREVSECERPRRLFTESVISWCEENQ